MLRCWRPEAPSADVAKQLAESVAALRRSLDTGAENGIEGLADVANALRSRPVDAYAQRYVLSVLDDLADDTAITVIESVDASIEVLRELRPIVEFKGKDVVDLHLLAAIICDRRAEPSGPALLMTHNKKEFDPRKRKVPEQVYTTAQLCWRDDFDLQTGLGAWHARYQR